MYILGLGMEDVSSCGYICLIVSEFTKNNEMLFVSANYFMTFSR